MVETNMSGWSGLWLASSARRRTLPKYMFAPDSMDADGQTAL